ncbi:ECF transporter S component [Nonomuraea polychroma]|uniref:ECF transporter S component n=1 Tax=Nonomuraea polychroma TaxID=46176 RepID=UPI003D8C6CC1
MSGRRFDTRTIMTCAAIGVATGLLLIPFNLLSVALTAAFPLLVTLIYGLWAVPALMGLAMLRRPGTGILTSTVAGLVGMPLSTYGWMMVVTMFLWGLIIEIPFAVTRYRVWSTPMFLVTSAIIGAMSGALLIVSLGGEQMSTATMVGAIVLATVSTPGFGYLSLLGVRALARAGVGGARRQVAGGSS